jgi:hypothetical protein
MQQLSHYQVMLVAFVKCEHTTFSLLISPVCPPKSEKYTHASQAVLDDSV